jgi:hypothetical protein
VLVHPFAGLVTVTVYVAGEEIVFAAVVIPPPQLKVAPPVVDEAVKVSLVKVQVKTAGTAMLAFGVVIFCVTVVEVVLVQPLAGLVTVTVHVAGVDIVLVAVVTPPPQLKVAPPVVEDAVSVSLVVEQVKTPGAAILAFGVAIFCVTETDAVLVQPFAGLVTVTVYVAGAETVLVAVVTPDPQLKVAPPVVDEAINVSLVVEHVRTVGAAIPALGTVIFCVTVAEAVLVHPFAGFVTVTVYVAGEDTILPAVVIPPPQLNVAPPVVDEAVNVSLVVAQVRTVGAAILALGAAIFCVTVAEAVLVHPFVGLVTVTVYVAADETIFVAVVTPPPQLKVAPPVVDEAVNVSLVLVQVKTEGAAILAPGATIFCVTVAEAVLVQPFAGFVTVTVYVAGDEIVFVAVVIPPLQLKVAPPVVDEAVNVSLVLAQVKTVGAAILALGVVIFWVTVAEAVLVQPFAGFVTVTV